MKYIRETVVNEVHLARVAGHTSLYLFFFSLIVVFVYVVGNLQGFLEETLLLLLDMFEWVMYVYCISDLYYVIFSFTRTVRGGKKYASLFLAVFGLVYGLGMLAAVNYMYSWLFW